MSQVKIKPRVPKGMRDFLPGEILKREYVFGVVREVFHLFGFEPLQTPVLELKETLMGKYGEDAEKLIYHAQHPGGKEEVAMRYDLTVPLARVVAQYENDITLPFKRYQLAPVWRAERPQRGRYREFYQCDADIVGIAGMNADAEILALIVTALRRLGFPQFSVKINNRKLLTGMGQYSGVPDAQLGDLYRSVDKFDKIGADGVKNELVERGLPADSVVRMMDLIQAKQPGLASLDMLEEVMGNLPAAAEGLGELRELAGYLENSGVAPEFYDFDFTMVRGLGYYTGPIFETIITEPNLGSITGGGRYDDLIGLFRKQTLPTVGTSLGIERIIDLMDELNLYPAHIGGTVTDIMVCFNEIDNPGDATKLAADLRAVNVKTELSLKAETLGQQFKYAEKKGISTVVILENDHIKEGQVKVKYFPDGREVILPRDEMIQLAANGELVTYRTTQRLDNVIEGKTYSLEASFSGKANTLHYGDNLEILRNPAYLRDESVDLVYLDPPNSSDYETNIQSANLRSMLVNSAPAQVVNIIDSLSGASNDESFINYLVGIALCALESFRILKPTGSIWFQSGTRENSYVKILLDAIFKEVNFRDSIIWKYRDTPSHIHRTFGEQTDHILFYSKSDDFTFVQQYASFSEEHIQGLYPHIDENGKRYRLENLVRNNVDRPNLEYEFMGVTRVWRYSKERMEAFYASGKIVQKKPGDTPRIKRYVDERPGTPIGNVWDDIKALSPLSKERINYSTQKPVALLERIIKSATKPGQTILDPYAGTGTSLVAATNQGRNWIGIDNSYLSIAIAKSRLKDAFPSLNYETIGEPQNLDEIRDLAESNPYQFERWVLSVVNAMPSKATEGDGFITFVDDSRGRTQKVIVEVKAGTLPPESVQKMLKTLENDKSVIGVLISFQPPSKQLLDEAANAGFYRSRGDGRQYNRVQILTVQELLEGKSIDMPQFQAKGKFE